MKTNAACIVIDTNVLISAAILPSSKTAKVIQLAITHFLIAQNDATWTELETRIAKDKFNRYFDNESRADYLLELAQSTQWFDAVANVEVSRDSDDDKFVSLAIDAGATIIISGDSDLKDIKKHEGIEILSPAQFFERYSG
jgi:uncharacterized protein